MPVGFPDYYGGLTLPVTVEEGGTGQTSLTQYGVLIGEGTSGVGVTAPGAIGDVLQIPAAGGAPVFQPLDISLVSLSGILPIANGGTGTATPALLAGQSIMITGAWPNQAIAFAPTVIIGGGYLTPNTVFTIIGSTSQNQENSALGVDAQAGARLGFWKKYGNVPVICAASGSPIIFGQTDQIDIFSNISTAVFTQWGEFSISGIFSLGTPLAVTSGGTGASSLTNAGIWTGAGQDDVTLQTAALSGQSLVASASGRRYLIAGEVHVHNASGAALSVTLQVEFTYGGVNYQQVVAAGTISAAGDLYVGGSGLIFPDSATAVTWNTVLSGFGASDTYDVHIAALGQ